MDEQKPQPNNEIYQATYTPEELTTLINQPPSDQLDDELTAVRITIRRTLSKMNQELDTAEFARLAWLVFHGARTIAYLSKTRHTISRDKPNDLNVIMARIMQELDPENGWE